MLIVVFGWLASGNSTTRRPLSRRYSVRPSTVGPCVMPGGGAACESAKANNSAVPTKRRAMRVDGARWAAMGEDVRMLKRDEPTACTASGECVSSHPSTSQRSLLQTATERVGSAGVATALLRATAKRNERQDRD